MTLSAYCLTGQDASSSLLVCNPVNDCKIGPSRCACVVKTEHARWPQNSRRDVELRWAHTRLRRKAGTESACRLGYHCSSQCRCLHLNAESKFAQPAHGCRRQETQIVLVLEAFLLSSGSPKRCLHPQAHLLACQRWGNSFLPTRCLLEGVRLSPVSWGMWPGSCPHTKTSDVISGLWLSFHLATAASDTCTIRRRSCHPAVCPNWKDRPSISPVVGNTLVCKAEVLRASLSPPKYTEL